MTENELIEEAKNRYPPGCRVDQTTAYSGNGNKSIKIKEFKPQYFNGNFSIAGVGVYSNVYKIWAEIVSYPEGYIPKSTNLLKQIEIW